LSTDSERPGQAGGIEIRDYRPEDADALRAILFAAFDNGELKGSTRHDVEGWHARLPADPRDTLVAVVGGEAAGLITPRRNQMVVARAFRRRGIGRRLVEAAEARNQERGMGPLYLALPHENEGARAFYAAIGFSYHHSLWNMRLRDDAVVPSPEFPANVERHHYRDEDVAAFVALVNAAFLDHPTPLSVSVERVRFNHAQPGFDPANLCLLSPVDAPGELIAFCRVDRDDGDGETIGEVAVLGVLPAWRRQGIGRELLHWGIHRLRELGAGKVSLAVEGENGRALRLYEELGFSRIEEWPRYARIAE
jgi:mycothiol synthase